jgi:hypothetical protein
MPAPSIGCSSSTLTRIPSSNERSWMPCAARSPRGASPARLTYLETGCGTAFRTTTADPILGCTIACVADRRRVRLDPRVDFPPERWLASAAPSHVACGGQGEPERGRPRWHARGSDRSPAAQHRRILAETSASAAYSDQGAGSPNSAGSPCVARAAARVDLSVEPMCLRGSCGGVQPRLEGCQSVLAAH